MHEAFFIYKQNVLTENWDFAMLRYDVELPNYINAIKNSIHSAYCKDCLKYSDEKDYLRIITGFAGSLYKYLFTRGHYQYGLKINEEGAKAHMKLGEYDLAIEDFTMLAQLYYKNDDIENAKKSLEQMKFCNSKLKDDSKSIHLYLIEGELIMKNEPDKSISLFTKGLDLLSKSKESDFKKSNTAIFNAEIGRVYENHLTDYEKALKYYKIASNIYSELKDYSNQFSCIHHIANCYAFTGQPNLALNNYKESLLGFINTGQKEYIGNSLSEIGRLRVDYPKLCFDFINEHIIKCGLNDLKEEIELRLKLNPNTEQYNLNAGLFRKQIYKLWNIIKLISFTDYLHLTYDWSNEVLIKVKKDEVIMYSYPWFFLNITKIIASTNKGNLLDADIQSIKSYCYLHGGEVEHEIYDPFKWLALWLEFKGIENTTRGKLFSEVENLD